MVLFHSFLSLVAFSNSCTDTLIFRSLVVVLPSNCLDFPNMLVDAGLCSFPFYLPWLLSNFQDLITWSRTLLTWEQKYFQEISLEGKIIFQKYTELACLACCLKSFIRSYTCRDIRTPSSSTGDIRLLHLSISGSQYGRGELLLKEGQSVTWSAPSRKKDQDVRDFLAQLKR